MGYQQIILDVRELEHPQPLEKAVESLHELSEKSYIHMIHRRNPIPLLNLLDNRGFQHKECEDSNGIWHILIAIPGIPLETIMQEICHV